MDRIRELLALLGALDALNEKDTEDLTTAAADLEAAAREARQGDLSSDVVTAMQEAAAAVLAIRAELDERDTIAAQITADADAALAAFEPPAAEGETPDGETPEGETPEGETEAAPEGETPETPEVPATTEGAAPEAPAAEEVPEPLAASGGIPARPVRHVVVPAGGRHQPQVDTSESDGRPALVASGEAVGFAAGTVIPGQVEAGLALLTKAEALQGSGNDGEKHYMVRADWKDRYPTDRRITANMGPDGITAVLAHAAAQYVEGITAAGGIPGPPTPMYEEITYGATSRPVRDALPNVSAPRGRIIYNDSPLLSDIVLDTAEGAIGTVSAATDLAGSYSKNIQEVSNPSTSEAVVEANTLRFQHGNFSDRFNPERLRSYMKLGQVAFARHNEALRLTDIKNGSTKYTDTPAKYGAYRDLKRAFIGAVAELEDRLRDDSVPFQVFMPGYVPEMLATDLLAQSPGDDTWRINAATVASDMASWHPRVRMTFTLDSIRGRQLSTPSGQSPRTAGFDADVEWCMFPVGCWAFLDGGDMDLGIVRDSVLNAVNKFQTFYESWEAVARLLSQTLSLWITSSLCADGKTQAPATIAACSPQGS